MSGVNQPLVLLQASVDEDDESYLRFLSKGKFVKYITIAVGVYAVDDMCFGPAITSLLPPLPSGPWNVGFVERDDETGQADFSRTVREHLDGVKNAWHQTKVDHLDLKMGAKLRPGVYEATSSVLPNTIVAKFARFQWEIDAVDRECAAYQCIDGHKVGPKFLGHITEEGSD